VKSQSIIQGRFFDFFQKFGNYGYISEPIL
jgi:hypothetical protein